MNVAVLADAPRRKRRAVAVGLLRKHASPGMEDGAVIQELEHFRIGQQGDVTIVTPTVFDFIDQTTNFESKKELIHFAQEQKPDKVVMDFQNVQRFSTEFIGTLLSFKKQMGAGGKIKLCSLQPVQRDIFRVLNLDGTVFQIHADVEEAVRSFA